MRITLQVDGEKHSIKILPENPADMKLLEFIAQNDKATVDVKRKYDYSNREIEAINLILESKQ